MRKRKSEISIFLMLRRFRRRYKSAQKKKDRRKQKNQDFLLRKPFRDAGKHIKSYSDALNAFLPINLTYLISCKDSFFYYGDLKPQKSINNAVLEVPEVFSIIDNNWESLKFLIDLTTILVYQSCVRLTLDYVKCTYCDLPTQILLDSILIDYDKFIKRCQKADIHSRKLGFYISSLGAQHIYDVNLQRMINSVGSPVELLNRKQIYSDVIPYKLRHYDYSDTRKCVRTIQKEIDTTTLIEYVDACLQRLNRELSTDAKDELGYIIGETLSNAEEHSTLKSRYLIGYFDETKKDEGHYGILHLVIMNYGKTIYEKFKNPGEDEPFNYECQKKMKELSDSFRKRNIFKREEFTEENLWTLYSLQGGVSSIPREVRKRGNGTIQFLDSFLKIKGNEKVDNISRMLLLSGNTSIEVDGTYGIVNKLDTTGSKIGVMSFNESGDIWEKPDSRYVKHSSFYFPGTMIYAKVLINEDDLQS